MANNEIKTNAEIYREQRKERLAKAQKKKNGKRLWMRMTRTGKGFQYTLTLSECSEGTTPKLLQPVLRRCCKENIV